MIGLFVELSIFLALCICFQGNTIRAVAESATNAPALVASVAELQDLPADDALEDIPVKISAIVLYHDAGWRNLFIQDGTRGLYLSPFDNQTQFEPGDIVAVSGFTDIETW